MADQIEEIKGKIDIVSLIGEYIDLKKAGRNYKALCPFHSEKTPSFMVSPELQIFKCFGCDASGDAIAFLQKYEGMDFPEALKFLADRVGVELKSTWQRGKSDKEKLYRINDLASKFYHYLLLQHSTGKAALNYLLSTRGLKMKSIKTFGLGFAPDSPRALIKFLKEKKGFDLRDLEQAGVLSRGRRGLLDRFRDRVIFPISDHRGNAIALAGRVLPEREKSTRWPISKYINSPDTPVYHKGKMLYGLNITRREIKKKETVVLVEGEFDLISSWQVGVKNVVATKGSALSEDQSRLLSRFASEAIFAFDSDIAGNLAARRAISAAEAMGFDIKVAKLGKYKDPDDAARADPSGYKKSLKSSVGVWDFLIDSVMAKHDSRTGTGKAKISRELVPILASISDKIVQAHYLKVFAEKMQVSPAVVADQLDRISRKQKQEEPALYVGPKKEEKGRRELLEERLLALIFQLEPEFLSKRVYSQLISTNLAKRILEEFRVYSKKYSKFTLSSFSQKLPKELVEGFTEMMLLNTEELKKENKEELLKEISLLKHELMILNIKEQLALEGKLISKYEVGGEKKKLKQAEKRISKLSEKLANLKKGKAKV